MTDKELHERLKDYQDNGGAIGADLEFLPYGVSALSGHLEPSTLQQMEFFAKTGSGGLYAVWIFPDGRRPVVYFCDEGVDTCIVAASISDFAKLVAVGYHRFPCQPGEPPYRDPDPVNRRAVKLFRAFVSELLDCEIPETGEGLAIHDSPDYPDIVQFFDDGWIRGPVSHPNSALTLQYPKHQRIGMTLLCLVLVAMVIAPMFIFPIEDPEDIAGVSMLILLVASIAVPSMLEFWFVRLDATQDGLRAFSPWRKNRFIRWDEIEAIDFSPTLQWFRLHTRSDGIVRLHVYLENVYPLLNHIERLGKPYPRVPHL